MHIDSYSYGKIKIDGKIYNKDLIIFPERVRPDWWRKEGHSLAREDLNEIINYKPEVLVVGKGDSGLMEIPILTQKILEEIKIKLLAADSHKAMRIFNEQVKIGEKVVGAFHLTC